MTYDSEEQKEFDESLNLKYEAMKHLFSNENQKHVMDYLAMVKPVMEDLNRKAREGEAWTDEEEEFFNKQIEFSRQLMKSADDFRKLLDHRLEMQSDAYFHHISKLAREGNAEAKKIYDDLLPEYRKAHGLDSNDPIDNN